ncbi:amidohydrolase family protein, partial [Deinococcus pimensis]|uniref:amidohydrolase family protein n=1 Tax=Deinococcus pimensis TaxID=309888 RepID=UPI0005EB0068
MQNAEMERRQRVVRVAQGLEPADLVVRRARVVLVQTGEIVTGDVAVAEGRLAGVGSFRGREELDARGQYLVPGFIDAHVHIESSTLTPRRFAQAVVPHGTTTVVCEPHEIVNVLGLAGLEWMLTAGRASGLRVLMSCPSSVPASPHEAGAVTLGAQEVRAGLARPGVLGLGEVMVLPALLSGDPSVWGILEAARGGVLDGHGPGLPDGLVGAYAAAGIHSDHEAVTVEQGRARLLAGQWLMVRDRSGARDLRALAPLLSERARLAMLVTDDTDARELTRDGHMDRVLRGAVAHGLDPLYALALVTMHPAEYWGL